jgi:hypothetical protein
MLNNNQASTNCNLVFSRINAQPSITSCILKVFMVSTGPYKPGDCPPWKKNQKYFRINGFQT